jgi:hypothetical protein
MLLITVAAYVIDWLVQRCSLSWINSLMIYSITRSIFRGQNQKNYVSKVIIISREKITINGLKGLFHEIFQYTFRF